MNIYEWGAIQAFRRGDREPLAKLLKERDLSMPLSKKLYEVFQELVDGKTGRAKGRPVVGDLCEQMYLAYLVGFHVRNGLRVKEALDKVSKERKRTFSYVERAHQKHRTVASLFFDPSN
ncbi:protein of unknown function [Nitrospira japonica]|uniref:Uncharacterized protein n=1 Tax=Nitrospira japonica TaxID=1325564 RepID=A0A1W1I347_9BACT|nr:protein of unknown function [Nitrospira japonica]